MLTKIFFQIFQYYDTNTIDFFASYGNTLIIMILTMVIWYIIGVFLAIWVYKDAQKRLHSESVWIIVVLITGFIGFLIYILHRNEEVIIEEEIDEENLIDAEEIL